MAIDFPNSPTAGDLYTAGGKTWQWNGTYWAAYGTGPVLRTSDTPPASPNAGDLWYETDTGRFFTYIDSAWVEIGNATDIAGALQPSQVTALSAVTSLTSDDVFPVVDGPSGAVAVSKITYGNLVTNMSSSLAPGLVLITSGITTNAGNTVSNGVITIGSAVSTVQGIGVFSSTYDNYLIQIVNTVASANQPDLGIQMTGTTSGYALSGHYQSFGSATLTGSVSTGSSYFPLGSCGNGTAGAGRVSMDCVVKGPFITQPTFFSSQNASLTWNTYYNGHINNTTSYTGFTILPSSGTLTGGTIRVYGYRN